MNPGTPGQGFLAFVLLSGCHDRRHLKLKYMESPPSFDPRSLLTTSIYIPRVPNLSHARVLFLPRQRQRLLTASYFFSLRYIDF